MPPTIDLLRRNAHLSVDRTTYKMPLKEIIGRNDRDTRNENVFSVERSNQNWDGFPFNVGVNNVFEVVAMIFNVCKE